MPSVVQICNMALAQLGDETIMALDELSKPARLCNTYYEQMRDDVLADATWVFGRERAALARLADAPAFEYDYAYQLPSDYIRMVRMGEEDDEYVWKVEGQKLLTDEEEANIVYIRRVTDPVLFSPKFVTCLVKRMAAEIAPALTGVNSGKKDALLREYGQMLMDAESIDSQESTPPTMPQPSRWHNARL